MTGPDTDSFPHSGLCWYALQRLPGLLDAFSREINGVKEAEDIEYIHRMRVASRRLRAALPLFRACFEEKQFKNWMKELTRITRALGEARDADVQIAFLQKSLKRIQKNSGIQTGHAPPDMPPMEPAIRFLLAALQEKRSTLQAHVNSSLAMLEKRGMTGEMQQVFGSMDNEIRATRKRPRISAIPMTAALRIGKRLTDLLSYEPWVFHPEAVAEHHAMRIAAKKLRYTMEVYGPAYRNNMKKPLARVKRVQEILGGIHDCDVWIDYITTLLLRERSLLRGKGSKRPDPGTLASFRILLHDREQERKRLYRQFVRYWQALARANLWEDLRVSLDSGRKSRYRPPASYSEDDAHSIVSTLSLPDPGSQPHSRHVTDLALMLFDNLQEVHNLGAHDRFILSCAGLLHYSGSKSGKREHNRHVAGMLFVDDRLPFDLEERAILADIVLSHQGKKRASANPYRDLISPDNRRKAGMLAALLRIADGLDTTRTGSVDIIRCTITEGAVSCSVSGPGDIIVERQHAQDRADLFLQVFGKPLVIS